MSAGIFVDGRSNDIGGTVNVARTLCARVDLCFSRWWDGKCNYLFTTGTLMVDSTAKVMFTRSDDSWPRFCHDKSHRKCFDAWSEMIAAPL